MQQLVTIKLLGAAGRKFGRQFKLAVQSPAEAFRALCYLFPELRPWVLDQAQRGVAWRVVSDGDFRDENTLDIGVSHTVVFAPVMEGAGGGGGNVFQIILGIALVAVAIFVPAAAFGLSSMLSVGLLGGGLILSGVAGLLTPTPKLDNLPGATGTRGGTEASETSTLESNLFSRNQGTGGQGESVPLLYGQRRVQSPRVISFNLRNLPSSRNISYNSGQDLIGYINGVPV